MPVCILNLAAPSASGCSDAGDFVISIFLPAPLTPAELTALKAIAATPPLRGLPYGIVKRLIDLGFAVTVRRGLIATEDGLLRVKLSLNETLRD
jgi:hypothetical protein